MKKQNKIKHKLISIFITHKDNNNLRQFSINNEYQYINKLFETREEYTHNKCHTHTHTQQT